MIYLLLVIINGNPKPSPCIHCHTGKRNLGYRNLARRCAQLAAPDMPHKRGCWCCRHCARRHLNMVLHLLLTFVLQGRVKSLSLFNHSGV